MDIIEKQKRYIACSRVTKRPIFDFISSEIHPNDALQVFPLEDDYSFGILSSTVHWEWFNARCSTLEERPRYTSDTVLKDENSFLASLQALLSFSGLIFFGLNESSP